jgi:hypothetical protein
MVAHAPPRGSLLGGKSPADIKPRRMTMLNPASPKQWKVRDTHEALHDGGDRWRVLLIKDTKGCQRGIQGMFRVNGVCTV